MSVVTSKVVTLGLCSLATLILSVACRGDKNNAGDAEYFRLLAPEMESLELDLNALAMAGLDLEGEALEANRLAYRDTLDAAATRIAALNPPDHLRSPQDNLVVATRDLADVSEREAALTTNDAPAFNSEEVAAQGLARAAEWYQACHSLQDNALTQDIDVDLKCVTALQ